MGSPGPGEWTPPPEDQNITKIHLEETTKVDGDVPEAVTTAGQLGLELSQYSNLRDFVTANTTVQLYNLIGKNM